MNRRLLQFLQAQNITQTQLADTLSVARGSVSNILSGRNKPGYDFLESLLLHYPNLNLEWLITGRGPMIREVKSGEDPAQMEIFSVTSLQETRKIDRIMVFYTDNTFQTFHPNE